MKQYIQKFLSDIPPLFDQRYIFFDIETTGLHAEHSILSLIGFLTLTDSTWTMIQLLNDDGESESELIETFFSYLTNENILIHYNGKTFDLPYIKKRCEQLNLSYTPLETILHYDFYSFFKPCKTTFHLRDCKQQTLETWIGHTRTDTLSGKQCIEQYMLYLTRKNEQALNTFLLHNYDDLCGLSKLSFLFTLSEQINMIDEEHTTYQLITKQEQEYFFYEISLPYSFPFSFHCNKQDVELTIDNDTLQIMCPIVQESLKYFYPNYKDYYYLPLEDMAIHKSVSSFVDKNHRQKATKQTCYLKKFGTFLPTFEPLDPYPFYRSWGDKEPFFYLDSPFSFSVQQEWLYRLFRFLSLSSPLHNEEIPISLS